jgi:hypothetical protein
MGWISAYFVNPAQGRANKASAQPDVTRKQLIVLITLG